MDQLTLVALAAQKPNARVIDAEGDSWCAACLVDHLRYNSQRRIAALLVNGFVETVERHAGFCFLCEGETEVYRAPDQT